MSKVYIHYEGFPPAPEKTSKLSIPKKWLDTKCVSDVIELFTDAYNKTNADHAIDKDTVHFQTER